MWQQNNFQNIKKNKLYVYIYKKNSFSYFYFSYFGEISHPKKNVNGLTM